MKRKAVSMILIAVFLTSLLTLPAHADPGIALDGDIGSGEWAGATTFNLVSFTDGSPSSYVAYITNDLNYMYVAFNYPVTTGSDFAAFNTYKQDAFDPEKITAPCVTPWGPVWDTIADSDDDGVPDAWAREDPTTRYQYAVSTATEMKVPLSQLGLSPGDTIRLIFVLNAHLIGTYVSPYPITDLSSYMTYTLYEPPKYWIKASGGGEFYDDYPYFTGHHCTIGLIGMSLSAIYQGVTTDYKGSGVFVDHDLKFVVHLEITLGTLTMTGKKEVQFWGIARVKDIDLKDKWTGTFWIGLVDDEYGSTNRFAIHIWRPDSSKYGVWHGTLLPGSEVTVWFWE